jgi:hypothetical protein
MWIPDLDTGASRARHQAEIRASISLYTQKRKTILLSWDIYKFRSVNQSIETFPFARQSWGIQPLCQELHEVE